MPSPKFYTMNNMRSGARPIKQSISRACRNHAFGTHESRHSPPSCKKKFVDANLKIKIQKHRIIKIIKEIEKLFVAKIKLQFETSNSNTKTLKA